ncbi:hypothetical protein Tco_1477900, partial [Tanacetum coccineum]
VVLYRTGSRGVEESRWRAIESGGVKAVSNREWRSRAGDLCKVVGQREWWLVAYARARLGSARSNFLPIRSRAFHEQPARFHPYFGVIPLELVTGKEATGLAFKDVEGGNLKAMLKMVYIAANCVSDNRANRPSMFNVLEFLKGIKHEL